MPKLKVLALHSLGTNGSAFKKQLCKSGLYWQLEDLLDIVFLDAPNPATGDIPPDVAANFAPPYLQWCTDTYDEDGRRRLDGLERSVAYLADAIREQGPFDGLMGFSLGGTVASTIVAMQQHQTLLQDCPKLRFCVMFAGVHPNPREAADPAQNPNPRVRPYYDEEAIDCPSLHVIGERDPMRDLCHQLRHTFKGSELIAHSRGHVIPKLQNEQLAQLRNFLQKFSQPQSRL